MTAEITRDASPAMRHPARFVRTAVSDLRASGQLTMRLVSHSLRAKYRQSLLGYAWLLVTPLAIAGVWLFLHSTGIVRFSNTEIPYPAFVVTGVFLWTGFLKMLNAPIQELQASRNLLRKVRFPWESLVIAGWTEALLETVVYFLVLAGVYAYFGISLLGILVALPVVATLFLLGGALGLLLAPVGLMLEDVQRSISVATFLFFFLTPVVYPAPKTTPGAYTWLINPVGILLVTSREIMGSSEISHPLLAWVAGAGALITLLGAWLLFRVSSPHLVSKL